ncbi:hypothetical protein QG37_07147 [Candidozyma auris]|nr:hypothetical protein QG37_07147 [[Candida] auris]
MNMDIARYIGRDVCISDSFGYVCGIYIIDMSESVQAVVQANEEATSQ